MQKIIPILLVFAAIVYGCKKQKKVEILISPELEAHFSFKTGTYWIYKDSISGQVDSFYVDRKISSYGADDYGVYRQAITLYINVVRIDTMPIQSNGTWEIFLADSVCQMGYSKLSSLQSIVFKFTYPFRMGSYVRGDSVSISKVYDHYTINGSVYDNIAKLNFRRYNSVFNDLYISNDVGIIKMKIHKRTDTFNHFLSLNWELQRCDIVR